MNRADILRIGRQAGAFIELAQEKDLLWLERFAALVACAEREACAMECLKKANAWTRLGAWGSNNEFHECAEAIRARGQA